MPDDPHDKPIHLAGAQAQELMRMGLAGPGESAPAQQLDGLEIGPVIGRGGMGTVYLARQCDLDRDVVVKVLSPGLANDPELAERLTREARLMAGLRHPHIVVIHQLLKLGGEGIAIVMEHVAGGNLRDLLREHPGGLPVDQARRLFRETASALGAAHGLGVIHRDVKPENILLDEEGGVRVADFGLAVRPDDPTPRLTLSSTTVGTVDYMAPEQFESGALDLRSDIYSLGVVYYEMLTGRVPRGSFPPPQRARGEIPERIGAAVMRALRPDPAERFDSMASFAESEEKAGGVARRRWLVGAASTTLVAGLGGWIATRPRDERSAAVAKQPAPPAIAEFKANDRPGPWRDLLETADPAVHVISGSWRRKSGSLESGASICILSQNVALPVDYDVRLAFTRLSGTHSIALFFTANGSTGTVDLDGWDAGLSGVQSIGGRDLRQGGGFHFPLEDGREYLLEVKVRRSRISVSVDGEMKSEHSVGEGGLGVVFPWRWNPPVTASVLGIGSWESPTRFHRLEWREVAVD